MDVGEPASASAKPEMPTIQRAFSRNAGNFQRTVRWVVALALVFISVSAIASVFRAYSLHVTLLRYEVNVATGVAAVFFVLAGSIRIYRIARSPERLWYGSRALAEQTRSLAWRYAVGGAPFPLTGAHPDATDARFQQALDNAASVANQGGIRYSKPRETDSIRVITNWMRQTRALSLDDRRATYAAQRIKGQQTYYGKHERENARAAAASQWLLLAIEVLGAVLAALNAFALLNLDLVGVAGTVAAGVAAWVQFNQFTDLASTYGAMAYRMAGYQERCLRAVTPWTEERWAAFVSDVEDALGAENGAWQRAMQTSSTAHL